MQRLLIPIACMLMSFTYACQEPDVEVEDPIENPSDKPSDDNKEEDKNDGQNKEDQEEPKVEITYEGHKFNDYGYQEEVEEPSYEGLTHLQFSESDQIFANPERGFYKHYNNYVSASDSPLSVTTLKADRINGITLYYTGYYLSKYMNSDISEDFLNLIRTNMQVLREAGAKCILRFAYTTNASDSNKSKWDAKPEIVQRHIQNVKPIVQEYCDVILCWQAGYVGVWGEWYYTNNFIMDPSTPEQHYLRKQVVDAMLEALPTERSVSLRTPMFKRMMYAKDYTDTLTAQTAYSGSALSRVSCFNDCFGAGYDDYGTFSGNKTREYWKRDTRYVLMGGETCNVSEYCTCEQSLKDMEDYHWTYLNSGYNGDVLGRWEKDGCMDEVKRRLGYRFSFSDVYHSEISAGADMQVVLRIMNSGFAAPVNPRAVELVLVDGNGKKTVFELNHIDPRFWFANKTAVINETVKIPADASGLCTLYLNLPDPKPTLHDNPDFSIRLANEGVWESETGYNKVFEFEIN